MSLVTELCALAKRYLADSEREFAEAAAAGDLQRAGDHAGAAFELAAALERQERMQGWAGQ